MNKYNLQQIINGKKELVTYHSYPTGTYSSHIIAECDRDDFDNPVLKVCKETLDEACRRLGRNRDNKEAVRCKIEGIEQPIYFHFFDFKYKILDGIKDNGGSREYAIPAKEEVVS